MPLVTVEKRAGRNGGEGKGSGLNGVGCSGVDWVWTLWRLASEQCSYHTLKGENEMMSG